MARRYSMARRTEQAEQTRERILTAALDLYCAQGFAATSVRQVARRAEVSPATVLNHFADGDALATAVVERIIDTIEVPSPAIFDGARTRTERIIRLVRELFVFYDRTEHWFHLFRAERTQVPALRQGEERFWTTIGGLFAQALGPAMANRELAGAAFGLTSPATVGSLRSSGLTLDEAAALIASLVASVVEQAMPERPTPTAKKNPKTRTGKGAR